MAQRKVNVDARRYFSREPVDLQTSPKRIVNTEWESAKCSTITTSGLVVWPFWSVGSTRPNDSSRSDESMLRSRELASTDHCVQHKCPPFRLPPHLFSLSFPPAASAVSCRCVCPHCTATTNHKIWVLRKLLPISQFDRFHANST